MKRFRLAVFSIFGLIVGIDGSAATISSQGFSSSASMIAKSRVTQALDMGVWYDGTDDDQSWTPAPSGGNPGGHARAVSATEKPARLFQIITGVGSLSGTYQLGFDLNNTNASGNTNMLEIAVWGFSRGTSFLFAPDQPLSSQEVPARRAYDPRTLPNTSGWETQAPLTFAVPSGIET